MIGAAITWVVGGMIYLGLNAGMKPFQLFEAAPLPVVANVATDSDSIDLGTGSAAKYTPSETARLNIPSDKIELDVDSSTYLGRGKRRFNFPRPIGTKVTILGDSDDDGGGSYTITAFMTHRADPPARFAVGPENREPLPPPSPAPTRTISAITSCLSRRRHSHAHQRRSR